MKKRKGRNDNKEEIKEDNARDKIIRYRVKKTARSEISKSKIWGNREKQQRKRLKKKIREQRE